MLIGINGGYFPAICRVCLNLCILPSFAVVLSLFQPLELLEDVLRLLKFYSMLWLKMQFSLFDFTDFEKF